MERATKREAMIKKNKKNLEEERNVKRQNIDETGEKIQDISFESEVETGTANQTEEFAYLIRGTNDVGNVMTRDILSRVN